MALPLDVAVVGGGAAGLATAIFAAREQPSARIAVLDGADRLGAKILISGGGRCNVTNRQVEAGDFNGGNARSIAAVLRAFTVSDAIAFFRDLGVTLHEERWGKLFPDSNRARTVLDALVEECRARGISLLTGHRVRKVTPGAEGFALDVMSRTIVARKVVLATGGRSLPRTGSDGQGYAIAEALGHTVVPTTPALVPLILRDGLHEGLAGVSHEVRLSVAAPGSKRRVFPGPMLWTHVGISGPAALDASRHWLRHRLEGRLPTLVAQLTPMDADAIDSWLREASRTRPRLLVPSLVAERVPASLAARVSQISAAMDTTFAELTRETRCTVVRNLMELELPVEDSRGFNHAEVTAGGVDLAEIDPATLASRRCPGLFLTGEILDVDGRLGGFNFQWAWASGRVAGRAAARSISEG